MPIPKQQHKTVLEPELQQLLRGYTCKPVADATIADETDPNYLTHLWATELCEAWHTAGRSATIKVSAFWLARQTRLLRILLDQVSTLSAELHHVTRPKS